MDLAGVNRVTLMGIYPQDNRDARLPFREASKQGDAALKKYIAQQLQGIGWKTDEIVKKMPESEDFYATASVQVKPPSLYKGRFIMVDDAGYATGPTGGGTSLALAGGYSLAGKVSKHKGDVAAGIRGYEERMRLLIDDM